MMRVSMSASRRIGPKNAGPTLPWSVARACRMASSMVAISVCLTASGDSPFAELRVKVSTAGATCATSVTKNVV